jgi:hypothetical protein
VGTIVIVVTDSGTNKPVRTVLAIGESNRHRAIALAKLRDGHTADERIEAVAELRQSVLDALVVKLGQVKLL